MKNRDLLVLKSCSGTKKPPVHKTKPALETISDISVVESKENIIKNITTNGQKWAILRQSNYGNKWTAS